MATLDSDDQVTVWIERLATGDDRAPEVIWNQYFEKIQRFAKRRLQDIPRRSADEQDVALSAFNSFFQAAKEDKFPKLNDRDDLWKLLITITARKVSKQKRKHFAQKRSGGRVSGESVFANQLGNNIGLANVLGTEPTPELVAEMEEEYEQLLKLLDDEILKSIVELKFQSYSNEEIAKRIEKNVRTVERKLSLVREIWATARRG